MLAPAPPSDEMRLVVRCIVFTKRLEEESANRSKGSATGHPGERRGDTKEGWPPIQEQFRPAPPPVDDAATAEPRIVAAESGQGRKTGQPGMSHHPRRSYGFPSVTRDR